MSTPLSIVFCVRNDDLPGFRQRVWRAQHLNRRLLTAAGVRPEWVVVEWNPLPDRPLLTRQLRDVLPGLRPIVVPAELHEQLTTNPRLGMLQFLAKNVGLRRAAGSWRLATNADTVFGPALVRDLRHVTELAPHTLYLARRRDVAPESVIKGNVLRGHVVAENWPDPPRNYGPCGDFMLMHTDLLETTRGYYEGVRFANSHLDPLFCRHVEELGYDRRWLGTVYHEAHDGTWANGADDHHGPNWCWQHVHVPYDNPIDWGLANRGGDILEPLPAAAPPPDERAARLGIDYADHFTAAVVELHRANRPVYIYGYGQAARDARAAGWLDRLRIAGVVDDGRPARLPWPRRELADVAAETAAVILVGSAWWSLDLAAKCRREGLTERVFPACLRDLHKAGRTAA